MSGHVGPCRAMSGHIRYINSIIHANTIPKHIVDITNDFRNLSTFFSRVSYIEGGNNSGDISAGVFIIYKCD